MPIKVVHVVPTLDQGGAEKQLCLLASHLDRKQFETHVVVLTHSGPREQFLREHDVALHFINKRGKFDPFAYRRLKVLLDELRPDIVHTWLFAANSYGRLAARAAKVPVILAGERCVDPWKGWWQIAVDRWLLSNTSAVVTNTSAITDFYASRGLPTERFVVIPNAVELPAITPLTAAEVCERLKIPIRKKIVMSIGRLWAQKNYQDQIWAGEMMHVGYSDVWYVIVGDGPERQRLLHYRDQIRGEEAVKFVGHRTDATELLSGADVLWNGSLYEGQSNTILEAMALGKPVVATDIPGTRDIVQPDVTGYLYALGDVGRLTRQTVHLLNTPELAASMGLAGQQRVREHFSIERMVQAHTELYLRLHANAKK